MALKGSQVAMHNKVAWAEICPKAKNVKGLGHPTNSNKNIYGTNPNKGGCQREKPAKVGK